MPTIPNRSDDLARPRARKGGDQQETKVGEMKPVVIPPPDPDWHKIALMIWTSLVESGQSDFYQQSDWASAYLLCDSVTEYLGAGKWDREGTYRSYRSPEMFKAIQTAMSLLLMTEGDRRKVRVELTQPEDGGHSAELYVINGYKEALDAPPKSV